MAWTGSSMQSRQRKQQTEYRMRCSSSCSFLAGMHVRKTAEQPSSAVNLQLAPAAYSPSFTLF